MTAATTTQTGLEYGVHSFDRADSQHHTVPCTDLTAALVSLSDIRHHVDAWAALMFRSGAGEWHRVGPDQGIAAFEAHLTEQRETHRG